MIAAMRGPFGFGRGRLPANRRTMYDSAKSAHRCPVEKDVDRPVIFEPSDAAFQPAALLRSFAFLLEDKRLAGRWLVFFRHETARESLGLREMIILLRIVIVVKPTVVHVVAAIKAHHFQCIP
jgi:hypothetical protein